MYYYMVVVAAAAIATIQLKCVGLINEKFSNCISNRVHFKCIHTIRMCDDEIFMNLYRIVFFSHSVIANAKKTNNDNNSDNKMMSKQLLFLA